MREQVLHDLHSPFLFALQRGELVRVRLPGVGVILIEKDRVHEDLLLCGSPMDHSHCLVKKILLVSVGIVGRFGWAAVGGVDRQTQLPARVMSG